MVMPFCAKTGALKGNPFHWAAAGDTNAPRPRQVRRTAQRDRNARRGFTSGCALAKLVPNEPRQTAFSCKQLRAPTASRPNRTPLLGYLRNRTRNDALAPSANLRDELERARVVGSDVAQRILQLPADPVDAAIVACGRAAGR